jgi:hypothetical protein
VWGRAWYAKRKSWTVGKTNMRCVACGKIMTTFTRFGATELCQNCMPTCVLCGIRSDERVCATCKEIKLTNTCCVCGAHVSSVQFKEHGNFCVPCIQMLSTGKGLTPNKKRVHF